MSGQVRSNQRRFRSCHVMSCHVMACHVMSCRVMSCHVMSCHVMSCHVMSCHVMSCHSMLGQGLKPCDVMSMLALWGPSWAHVGGYVGPSWGLCWRMLDRKAAQNNHRLKAYQTWPKNALASGLRGATKRPGQPPEGPKTDLFWATSKTSVVDIPTRFQNAAQRAYKTRFVLPPSEKHTRFLWPPWPLLAPCWPVLGAMSAHLGGSVGAILGHVVTNGKVGASETTPRGSPQRPVARTRTRQRMGKRVGNHSRRLSPVACRAHTNAAPHG